MDIKIAPKVTEVPKFKLEDRHLNFAKEMLPRHITKRYMKKGCKRCNLTGVDYITDENMAMPCPHCVNLPPAREEWNDYCKQFPELKEKFKEVN